LRKLRLRLLGSCTGNGCGQNQLRSDPAMIDSE
jgi:hypothetical protein